MSNRPAGEMSRPGDVLQSNLAGIASALANAVYREQPTKLEFFHRRVEEVINYGSDVTIVFGVGMISIKSRRENKAMEMMLTPSVVEDHYLSAESTPEERRYMAKKYAITSEQKMVVVQEIAKHFGIADLEFVCTEFRTDSDESTQRDPAEFAEMLFRGIDAGFGSENFRTLSFKKRGVMRMDVKGNTYGHEYYLDVA